MPIEDRPAFRAALVALFEGRELTEQEKAALAEENRRVLGLEPVEES